MIKGDSMATKEEEWIEKKLLQELTGQRTEEPKVKKKDHIPDKFKDIKEAPAGEVTYLSLFGKLPSGLPDFAVNVYKEEDWNEDDRKAIPSIEKFKHYMIDHNVLYPLLLGMQHNMNTLLTGPTGCGKSTIVEYICATIKQPFLRINGRQDMESDTLLGRPWVSAGEMKYMLGDLPKARAAGWMILFDEPWKTPSGIQMALQRMYEKNGVLQLDDMPGTLDEKQIKPDPRSRFILADNVVGTGDGIDKYAATLIQDGSTLNRMELVLQCTYLSKNDESKMLQNKHSFLPKYWADKMVQLAGLIRVAYQKGELSGTMSPRQLDTWATMSYSVGDYKTAFNYVMTGRFATDEEKGVLDNLWNTVYKE